MEQPKSLCIIKKTTLEYGEHVLITVFIFNQKNSVFSSDLFIDNFLTHWLLCGKHVLS